MKNVYISAVLIVVYILAASQFAAAQSTITPDSTFGINGHTFNSHAANFKEQMSDMAVQADGKILSLSRTGNAGYVATLIRFMSDGNTLDSTFGIGGYTYLDGHSYGYSSSLKILSSGKILVSGNGDSTFIARVTANGTLDSTFGINGYRAFSSAQGAIGLVVTADGSIISAYFSNVGSNTVYGIAKMDANGVIDNTYGTTATGSVANMYSINKIVLDNDGKLLVAGTVKNGAGNEEMDLLRLLPTGATDNSFGNNGLASYYDSTNITYNHAGGPIPVVLADNSTLLAFTYYQQTKVVYFSHSGVLDFNYGNNGSGTASTVYGGIKDATLLGNGELLILGQFLQATGQGVLQQAELAVMTNSGHVDTVFNGTALNTFRFDTAVAAFSTSPVSVKLIGGNKILVGGKVSTGLATTGFARFNYTGFTVGIDEVNNTADLKIFPNPASDHVTLSIQNASEQIQVSFYDIVGHQVYSRNFAGGNTGSSQTITVPITGVLSPGVYIAMVKIGDTVNKEKFVVQK